MWAGDCRAGVIGEGESLAAVEAGIPHISVVQQLAPDPENITDE